MMFASSSVESVSSPSRALSSAGASGSGITKSLSSELSEMAGSAESVTFSAFSKAISLSDTASLSSAGVSTVWASSAGASAFSSASSVSKSAVFMMFASSSVERAMVSSSPLSSKNPPDFSSVCSSATGEGMLSRFFISSKSFFRPAISFLSDESSPTI